jgi:iron complex transport system substrate-binding protein
MEPEYAESFDIYEYEAQGVEAPYRLIDVHDSALYLLVPEGAEAPAGLPKGITVLGMPLQDLYVAATSSMALFDAAGALDLVKLTGTDVKGWYIDAPKKALESGAMRYAGKYSAPDYELLQSSECDLAVESMMILHTPEVKEMIEKLDVPVLVDRSSYEEDPLGRAEWIKLYGVLTDHQEDADAFFNEQMEKLKDLDDFENTEKTVAFFYLTADGKVVVRKSTDYVPKMIEIAGARYAFADLEDDSDRTSVDMSVETFYETAVDADYIIYNGSIDGSVKTMDDLLAKDPIMKELKAVKDNKCWVTGDSMYQRTDIIADMILDFHKAFTEDDPSDLKYIQKLQ